MGLRTRKPPSPTQQPVRKPKAGIGGSSGGAPKGCPEAVTVRGTSDGIAVGQPATLTIAGDRPQLVIASRVRSASTISERALVTRCLREGASYLGRVTHVSGTRFEVALTLGG